jgi:uncharacterized protein YecT (DUF1311 family)
VRKNWIPLALLSTAAAVVALTFASLDDNTGKDVATIPRIYDSAAATFPTVDSNPQQRSVDSAGVSTRASEVVVPEPPKRDTAPARITSPAERASTPAARDSIRPQNDSHRSSNCETPTARAQRSCLLAEIDRYDVALTRTYQALIRQLRDQAGGVREPPAVQSLRAEQRAWIVERDRVCRRANTSSNGPLWALERLPCFERMSDEREQVLRARIGS